MLSLQGTFMKHCGRMLDRLGIAVQGESATLYRMSKHRRLIPFQSDKPQLETPDIFIAPSASVVGSVAIGDKSSVWYNTIIRGDLNPVDIGSKCSIGENCVLHCSGKQMEKETASPLIIGDNVIIESGSLLQGCTIQSYANIQLGSIVLDSAIIGSFSIIAAGSLVPSEVRIPSKQLWGGNPVQYIRDLSDEEVENLKKISEEKLDLSKKHETEHMKDALQLKDDNEQHQFGFERVDKGRF